MIKRQTKLPKLFLALLGLLFGSLVLFSSTPVIAAPEDLSNSTNSENNSENTSETSDTTENTDTNNNNDANNTNNENSTENSEENSEKNSSAPNCYDQAGAISWIVCPTIKTIAKAVDAAYNIIEDFLVVKPISTDADSPIYQVWEYARGITNVVFIIFILIIVYSQITGLGISNYGVKKTLPKIIIAAILVNLSYIICSFAVDISNIIGSSLVGFFDHITETVVGNNGEASHLSWSEIAGGILTGVGVVGIGALAASLSGGIIGLLWLLIPVIIGAIISIIIALIMISLRQALVVILVMIAPLAFVAYLLPNTSRLFDSWRKLFTTMLVFYPMFSLLFGASSLIGWILISSAQNAFWVVIGMAVQIIPLCLALPLMKTSGTFLDRAGNLANRAGNSLHGGARNFSASRQATARARHTAKGLQNPLTFRNPIQRGTDGRRRFVRPVTGRSLSGAIANYRARNAEQLKQYEDLTNVRLKQQLEAQSMGKQITGFDKQTGRAIYAKDPKTGEDLVKSNRYMRDNLLTRAAAFNAENTHQAAENAIGSMGTYLTQHNITDTRLRSIADQQAQNYLDNETLKSAARRNDLSDKRYYFGELQKAAERHSDGTLKNPDAYRRFIEAGAGADAFVDSSLTGQARADAEKTRFDATTSVVADAYDMIEKERAINTAKYTTYLDKQVSFEVDKVYDQMLASKNIEGIVAAQNITAKRGDYDKIEKKLGEYMDQEGYLELNTDFANVLALNLLGMKNAAPSLGRLGKHINVETWRYTNGDRDTNTVTMKEYFTGKDASGQPTKFNAQGLLQGTSLKEIDRTFYSGLEHDIDKYLVAENFDGSASQAKKARDLLFRNMTPSLISAISSFSSGSEQMVNTANFITGAKYHTETDTWDIPTDKLTPEKLAEHKDRTEIYLKMMTTENVIGFKTDAFKAVIAQLQYQKGGDENAALAEFRKIMEKKGVVADLERIKATNPSALSGMRPGIRRALGV
ncbi:hypothetical protein IJI91_00585 [Candidatus Saccharibacteria bacterium]|nr:hypothetical protein [Candidatus Saccharibacteria bacterium]